MASGLVAVLIVKTIAGGVSPGPRVTQAIAVISVMLVVLALCDLFCGIEHGDVHGAQPWEEMVE